MKRAATGGGQKKPIEWERVRQRLADLHAATERGRRPSADDIKRVLAARAQALARPPAEAVHAEQWIEVIQFCLAYENYGVESAFVREVFPLTDITRVPCTPPFVLGVINVRGEIVSVIDLKKFFDLPEKGLTDLNKVIIIESDVMTFGILADVVTGIRLLAADELQASVPTLGGIRAQYLKGITKDRTVILDATKLLADGKIVVDEQVEA